MKLATSASNVVSALVKKANTLGIAGRVAFSLFLFMVLFSPVPEGSISIFWIEVWSAVAAFTLMLANYRDVSRGQLQLLIGVVIVLFAYCIVALLQSISPGPAPLPIWTETAQLLDFEVAPVSGSVSGSPLLFLGRPLLGASVFVGGVLFGTNERHADLLLKSVIYTACIFGLFGLAETLIYPGDSQMSSDQGGALAVLFVSKNTTATYLGSAFLAALALLMLPLRKMLTAHSKFEGGVVQLPKGFLRLAVAAFLLVLLLPLTQSRAGLLFTISIAGGAIGAGLRFRRRALGVVAICGIIILSVVFAFSGNVWRVRQARLDLDADARWQAYALMWDAVAARPWFGYGLGSFAESFPQFRDESLKAIGRFNIGHSAPLELAFEGGLPLALLVVAFVAVLCAILVRGVIRRPGDPYILAALLVGLLGAVHSSVDFSLQIPGYLIICSAIVGVGVGRAFLPKKEVVYRRLRRQRRRSEGAVVKEGAADGGPRE